MGETYFKNWVVHRLVQLDKRKAAPPEGRYLDITLAPSGQPVSSS
jgi:hypothetical protein